MSELEPTPTVRQLLEKMTLAEKIGQMTQAEKGSVTPDEVADYALGSVLSGGGGNPHPNTPALWREMVEEFQQAALRSRLGVPLLYGSDAVHGHNNVKGATVFPHNIAVGMTGEPELARRIGRATALECVATGVRWTFAPAVSIPRDLRWGRTFEGYAQQTDAVSAFASAFIDGLKGEAWHDPTAVLPSVKHYVADGAARWGSSARVDRGALELDRTLALSQFGEGFVRLVEQGAWMIAYHYDATHLRLEGYRHALHEAGLTFDPALLRADEWHEGSGYTLAHELMALPEPPDAIFCCNDNLAIGALDALHELGVAVPGEVALVGFNNGYSSEHQRPPLTSVALPLLAMGKLAGEQPQLCAAFLLRLRSTGYLVI